jgi:hypothetical protein
MTGASAKEVWRSLVEIEQLGLGLARYRPEGRRRWRRGGGGGGRPVQGGGGRLLACPGRLVELHLDTGGK